MGVSGQENEKVKATCCSVNKSLWNQRPLPPFSDQIIIYAVSIKQKAAILLATSAGSSRRRGFESIAKMSSDEKDNTYRKSTHLANCGSLTALLIFLEIV